MFSQFIHKIYHSYSTEIYLILFSCLRFSFIHCKAAFYCHKFHFNKFLYFSPFLPSFLPRFRYDIDIATTIILYKFRCVLSHIFRPTCYRIYIKYITLLFNIITAIQCHSLDN
jgi:hypothetical protein